MANAFINGYMGDPNEELQDGTAISTDDTQTAPLVVNLDASQNEAKKVKLGIRCESGYQTVGDVTILAYNDTNDRWKFSLTENGTYSDTITIPSTIYNNNVIFWAQASSSSLESPMRDTSVKLRIRGNVQVSS